MQRLISILLLYVVSFFPAVGQTVPADLVEAFKNGNATRVSAYFHQNLEMTILEKNYVTSKNQAVRIMDNFFKKHSPTDFKISFEGTKEKSKYAIGSLKTADATFRVNILFLNKQNERLIYYLSIEKESLYELNP
ncbi:MAG: DUF4783 domain-containing protein [Bacteroidales bacterium]|nr:DUF4783 domain-containing protein [Bacteroidales bacterium]